MKADLSESGVLMAQKTNKQIKEEENCHLKFLCADLQLPGDAAIQLKRES